MEIQKSSEDYLETMLMMQKKHGFIRSIDVAEHLGVTKPSVSYATKRLRENGYITMDKTGLITLEPSGLAIAQEMLDPHRFPGPPGCRPGHGGNRRLQDRARHQPPDLCGHLPPRPGP